MVKCFYETESHNWAYLEFFESFVLFRIFLSLGLVLSQKWCYKHGFVSCFEITALCQPKCEYCVLH